jgi:hypothetical protein
MKIDKKIFDSLLDEDTPMGVYKANLKLCDARACEITLKVFPDITSGPNWFTYSNCGEDDDGEFDPVLYEEVIIWTGRFPDYPIYGYSDGCLEIPTRWLWTDDEDILAEYKKEKQKVLAEKKNKEEEQKIARLAKKAQKEEMKKIISTKLTKEELNYITFK